MCIGNSQSNKVAYQTREKGLYAKKAYKKGDIIGWYKGKKLSTTEHSLRYGADDSDHAPYSLQGAKSHVIDASCQRFVLSQANGSKYKKYSNAEYVGRGRKKDGALKTLATKSIAIGEEIIVHYGRDYFKSAHCSSHKTY